MARSSFVAAPLSGQIQVRRFRRHARHVPSSSSHFLRLMRPGRVLISGVDHTRCQKSKPGGAHMSSSRTWSSTLPAWFESQDARMQSALYLPAQSQSSESTGRSSGLRVHQPMAGRKEARVGELRRDQQSPTPASGFPVPCRRATGHVVILSADHTIQKAGKSGLCLWNVARQHMGMSNLYSVLQYFSLGCLPQPYHFGLEYISYASCLIRTMSLVQMHEDTRSSKPVKCNKPYSELLSLHSTLLLVFLGTHPDRKSVV